MAEIAVFLGVAMLVFGAIKLVGYFQRICFAWPFSMICNSALMCYGGDFSGLEQDKLYFPELSHA